MADQWRMQLNVPKRCKFDKKRNPFGKFRKAHEYSSAVVVLQAKKRTSIPACKRRNESGLRRPFVGPAATPSAAISTGGFASARQSERQGYNAKSAAPSELTGRITAGQVRAPVVAEPMHIGDIPAAQLQLRHEGPAHQQRAGQPRAPSPQQPGKAAFLRLARSGQVTQSSLDP